MKKISLIYYFLFKKEHEIINNRNLFKYQSDLAKFATTVPGCNFYKKTPEGIRPFLNQQLKSYREIGSKPIKRHLKTYSLIVTARVKEIKHDITEDELQKFIKEFREYFSKDSAYEAPQEFMLFDEITAELLHSLKIVAIANGGSLTEKEFVQALNNLKQKDLS